jgi:hypothetical protein
MSFFQGGISGLQFQKSPKSLFPPLIFSLPLLFSYLETVSRSEEALFVYEKAKNVGTKRNA